MRRHRGQQFLSLDETSTRANGMAGSSRVADAEELNTSESATGTSSSAGMSRNYSSFHDRPTSTMPHAHKSKSCSDIAVLKRTIDNLYRNYTHCRWCHQTDITSILDDDGSILMVQCQSCDRGFGVDDSMSPDVLLELYHHGDIQVQVGCCGNANPDEFRVEGFNGRNFIVRCLVCNQISVLGEGSSGSTEPEADDPNPDRDGLLMCQCGNQDQEKMAVCLVGDEIRCVSCEVCGEFIKLPSADQPEMNDVFDPSELISCKCRPHRKKIKIVRDAAGEPDIIACETCGNYCLPKEADAGTRTVSSQQKEPTPPKSCSTTTRAGWLWSAVSGYVASYMPRSPANGNQPAATSKDNNISPSYREVRQLSDLKRADHIKWERYEGYSHHAITEHVLLEQSQISVVHYNGPSPSTHKVKGMIIAEQINPFEAGRGRLFVADYSDPLPPDSVLNNAHSRMGEVEYSLCSNNCEHFATWCKTGQHMSSQVLSVQECFKKYGKACANRMLKTEGKHVRAFGRYGTVAMMALNEVKECVEDISKATEDRKGGRLSRDAYVELVVKRTTRSVGGLGGMALGMCVPIPLVGEFIGGTLGGAIGEYAGRQLGVLVVQAHDKIEQSRKQMQSGLD